jgi:lysyl endopeptidase
MCKGLNKGFAIIISILLYSQVTYAGFGRQGVPPGITYGLSNSRPETTMPLFDSIKTTKAYTLSSAKRKNTKSLPYAYNYDVNISNANSGQWYNLSDGSSVWSIDIVSKGAYSLSVIFDSLQIPENHLIYLYNPEDTIDAQILGKTESTNGIFFTYPIDGKKLRIEYYIPANSTKKAALNIVKVSHAYLSTTCTLPNEDAGTSIVGYKCSASCNVDINCSEGYDWQKEKRAILKIYVPKGTTTEVCTGTLLNNTENDKKPYVYTAHHCLETALQATGTIFTFNYERPYCNGAEGLSNKVIYGSTLRATNSQIDFTLVELSDTPTESYEPYYAGWSISTTPANNVSTIHHPWGDVKKISFSSMTLLDTSFWGYYNNTDWLIRRWSSGTTEKGSSGCPLFDSNHRLIGSLVGGDASCSYPYNDMYLKFNKAWDFFSSNDQQLKHWLDPTNTSPLYINGYAPYPFTNINTYSNNNYFSAFPNPASTNIKFSLNNKAQEIKWIEIYDNSGRLIFIEKNPSMKNEISVILGNFQEGIYFYKGFTKTSVYTGKFIVIK